MCCAPDGCEKYSLDGSTGTSVKGLNNTARGAKVISLGDQTYAVGTGHGMKVEVWNGWAWDMASQEFQVKEKRYSAGVMAVPRDFVCKKPM